MIPYFLMAILYLMMAILMALESSLSSFKLLPWFNGMIWLRVHFITLGALVQVLFAMLPIVGAIRYEQPRPAMRWDIWATLNGGIALLLIGIPLVSAVPIIAGGMLVFAATVLLIVQLSQLRREGRPLSQSDHAHAGRKFYIAGLFYFLVGILIGTGLWTGWLEPLYVIGNGKEVHIHANNWGLASLVFAGLLIDFYPVWAKRPLAFPKTVSAIFWLMTLGAFGLIFGPWLATSYLTVPGLVLHLAATIMLLVNIIKPLWPDKSKWQPGWYHMIVSYLWLLLPILMAPVVLFGVGDLPAETIETYAPQALIYGWVLQFSYAILPYFFRRVFQPDAETMLGGNWFSFVTVNLGGIFLWASIFISAGQGVLYGTAYLLWMLSMIPIVADLWHITRDGMAELEQRSLLA